VHRGGTAEEVFGRGEVMIGPGLARARHLDVGDTFTIPARLGPRQSFTVGGIWASPSNLGRSVTMTGEQLLALTGPRPAGSIALVAKPGVSAEELAARVKAAHISDRLRVLTPDQLADDLSKEFLQLASPFDALRFALVAVALVATASTLVLAAVQRRRDNATLAALGMAPVDLARSTLIETVITALVVAFVATLCGQFALINFTWASAVLTGLAIPYRFALSPVIVSALVVTLIAVLGAALPAWRTARTNVMDALRTA
jgi:putative ABC transport system permease protein